MVGTTNKDNLYKQAYPQPHFTGTSTKPSTLRNIISSAADAKFPPEPGRYYFYLSFPSPGPTGRTSGGYKRLQNSYFPADPRYIRRFRVPVLWDSKTETAVNNESANNMRMFYTSAHSLGGYYSFDPILRTYIRLTITCTRPVFLTMQSVYDENVMKLCAALVAYFMVFRCSLRMKYGYPHIDRWMRRLRQDESERTRWPFKDITALHIYKPGYLVARLRSQGHEGEVSVPAGPVLETLPPVADAGT
ncbi:hypothetical protein BDW66DRAFT_161139 [Aspergillus desertorum]